MSLNQLLGWRNHVCGAGEDPSDDARALLRQVFQSEADLTPDLVARTLTVKLHHSTQAAHDRAIEQLLTELNSTMTVFPGSDLTLAYKLGAA